MSGQFQDPGRFMLSVDRIQSRSGSDEDSSLCGQTSQFPGRLDRSLDTTLTELSWFEYRKTDNTFSGYLAKEYLDPL
jgi:hypothetical protein